MHLNQSYKQIPVLRLTMSLVKITMLAMSKRGDAGYFVRAVHHPTVPKGQSRLRITITAQHSVDQISELAQQINNVMMSSRVIG